jgi:predicted O-methyltransferase YrrM
MTIFLGSRLAGICVGAASFGTDLRRRHLSFRRTAGWNLLSLLDMIALAVAFALAAASVVLLTPALLLRHAIPLDTPKAWRVVAYIVIGAFLWGEGRRQVQLQRPRGLVFAEGLILIGLYSLMELLFFSPADSTPEKYVFILSVVVGAIVVAIVVPPFVKGREEHRILDRIAQQGEFVQPEWVPPTPECPHPERWHMLDAQSAELEVLDFLKSLILLLKPDLIVETGTFIGHSALVMAQALETNGRGRLVTIEYDAVVFEKAKENIASSNLRRRIEYRNGSSLEQTIDGPIDILYSDSDVNIREQEVRKFLPQIRPGGLVLIHDASSHFKVVRAAALRMEEEGLLSVVLLSSPRGLCLAQKRSGRV